jgi:D-glycero-alpha-D-manno-heptose 1-phosphate guanylyltransferase
MKAALLVGGLGTRLRSVVPLQPKALASIGNRPFLELLVRQLCAQEIRQLVMCTGYLAEQIKEVFNDGNQFDVTIEYSEETVPLGTAGALRLASRYIQHEVEFLVLNGDSFLDIDLNSFLRFHRKHGNCATMAVVSVEDTSRFGTVQIGPEGRILSFVEKTGERAPGIINAGVYVFSNTVLEQIPKGHASLERDVLPHLLEQGVYAFEQQGMFIDIGIPEDYARASKLCNRLANAASGKHGRRPISLFCADVKDPPRSGQTDQLPSNIRTHWK